MRKRFLVFVIVIVAAVGIIGTLLLIPQTRKIAYHELLNQLYRKNVPTISVTALHAEHDSVILLDARSRKEFEVSHIRGARWVGFDHFQLGRLAGLSKDKPIVVYCSVGVRSEKIAEKLQKAGYKHVMNLYGGIFEWVNDGFPVYKSNGMKTNDIDPYNSFWGFWLTRGKIAISP